MTANITAVEIRDLSVTFSRWGQSVIALDHVNLTIPKGQWVMLVGHNGSGKSTLLRTITGRHIPNSGKVFIGGKQTTRMNSSEFAQDVFHVYQDPLKGTAPKLTVFENLMVADYKAYIENISRRELAQRYKELLQPLGLEDRMKQLAGYLSGGERQLIALLIVRLRPASLLLLDEPLAALDPAKAKACMALIARLNSEGMTIMQVTHDPSLAVGAGNRTLALREGKLVYDSLGYQRSLSELEDAWSTQPEASDNQGKVLL